MALNPRAEHIYELASIWLNECLLGDGSLFWPERNAWTKENLDSFWSAFAENLDEGSGSFVEKWSQQLEGQSDDVHRMAVEVAAIYCLFPRDAQMGQSSKRRLIADVLAFSGDLGDMSPDRWSLFEKAIEGGGIGLTGAGYLAARPFHIGMYLGFAKTVKSSGATSITDIDPKPLLDDAFQLVSTTMNYKPVSTVHILLHILWPERFEDYASADYKKRMAKNLSAHFGLPELDDVDDTIYQARQHMEANGYPPNFSMYEDGVIELWEDKAKTPDKNTQRIQESNNSYSVSELSVSKVVREKAEVYETARLFFERVIRQRSSLLWPDQELWTEEAIEEFLQDFRAMLVIRGNSWLDNYETAMASGDNSSVQILADSYAFLMQFPSIDKLTATTKSNDLQRILSWTPEPLPDQATLTMVDEAFGLGIGAPGQYFSAHIPYQLAFVPAFVREYRSNPASDLLDVVNKTAGKLKDEYEFKRSVVPAQNIVLHLLDPENFERIASRGDKSRIVEGFTALIDFPESDLEDGLDSQLRVIRNHLANGFFPKYFDYYDADVQPFWNSETPPPWPPGSDRNGGTSKPSTITDLGAKTFLDEPFLRDIETLLESKQQLIFEGPPGSGKTYVAEQFARYFTEQSLDGSEPTEQIELVQFHQSYTYEDFVEGIRPHTNEDGQLVYDVEPGIFRELASKAWLNTDKKFVLIIDEINRGNVSRILGELMLLLEYRGKSATLPYSKKPLQIPPNLYIIGTMNTADRSLSQIDYALRRRFYFLRFMSVENDEAHVLDGWLQKKQLDTATHRTILQSFISLNLQLEADLGTDDLQVGHSYFMDDSIHDDRHQQHIWNYAVLPLIREYLYHHRERDSLLQNYQRDRILRVIEPAPIAEEPAGRIEDGE